MISSRSTRCPSSISDVDDLARDLRRHRGLAARDDVARRIEDRPGTDHEVGGRGFGGRDGDLDSARDDEPSPAAG